MTCPICGAESLRDGARYWCPACGTLTDWPGPGFVPEIRVPLHEQRCRDMTQAMLFNMATDLQWDDFIRPLIYPE